MDNSIQADATQVELLCDEKKQQVGQRVRSRIHQIYEAVFTIDFRDLAPRGGRANRLCQTEKHPMAILGALMGNCLVSNL